MNKKIINKKGFTLIELLAVISILAIIAVIATPNIVTLVDNSKKQEFVTDAISFTSKASEHIWVASSTFSLAVRFCTKL